MPYLSASAVVIHYEEALHQPLPLPTKTNAALHLFLSISALWIRPFTLPMYQVQCDILILTVISEWTNQDGVAVGCGQHDGSNQKYDIINKDRLFATAEIDEKPCNAT